MKGPGIKDYLEVIKEMKESALKQGKETFGNQILKSYMHLVSPNFMRQCHLLSGSLYKIMLEGDEILPKPKGIDDLVLILLFSI